MRYLITSTRTPAQVILGYDANGYLCEVQAVNLPENEKRLWPFQVAPLLEENIMKVFGAPHLKVASIKVTFEEFWEKYNYKECKKDALSAWGRLSEANQQLAFDHIATYQDKARRDSKAFMYPATYLRSLRWNDNK